MDDLCAPRPPRQRRRHSPEFNARIIAACQEPGVSVARVALNHGPNANMVRQCIKAFRTAPPAPVSSTVADDAIRIEVTRANGTITITWPVDHADRAMALLRELLL